MPTEAQDEQIMLRTPEGNIRIENFNRTINSLNYIVGHVTYHVLYIGNERVVLNEIAQSGTLIELTLELGYLNET